MYAKFSKCEFWITEVGFLGHVLSASGVSMDPGKVEAVMSWERLKSVFEIVAPLFGPTRLEDLNWFRDARLILFIYLFFSKVSQPESLARPERQIQT